MAKVVDITEKLSFDENPVIRFHDTELEVNADAGTVLRILGIMDGAEHKLEAVIEAAELLFREKDMEKLKKMSFKDFMAVVDAALGTVTGEDEWESKGEGETHTTT